MIIVGLAAFAILKIYPLIVERFNLYGAMILFSIVALLGAIFTVFVVEETKGKNLDTLNSSERGLDAVRGFDAFNDSIPKNSTDGIK